MIIVQEHDAEGFLDLTAEVEIRHNTPCQSVLYVKSWETCSPAITRVYARPVHSRAIAILQAVADKYGCKLDMV
jgi:hypothetical protein